MVSFYNQESFINTVVDTDRNNDKLFKAFGAVD